jgi:hypothetical protein
MDLRGVGRGEGKGDITDQKERHVKNVQAPEKGVGIWTNHQMDAGCVVNEYRYSPICGR